MDSLATAARTAGGIDGPDVIGDEPEHHEAHQVMDCSRLVTAMEALPREWQLALWQVDVLGRTPAQTAAMLDITADSVHQLVRQARTMLRDAYSEFSEPSLD